MLLLLMMMMIMMIMMMRTHRFRQQCVVTLLAGKTDDISNKRLEFRYSSAPVRQLLTPTFWRTTRVWSQLASIVVQLTGTRETTEDSQGPSCRFCRCVQPSTSTPARTKLVTDCSGENSESSNFRQESFRSSRYNIVRRSNRLSCTAEPTSNYFSWIRL